MSPQNAFVLCAETLETYPFSNNLNALDQEVIIKELREQGTHRKQAKLKIKIK